MSKKIADRKEAKKNGTAGAATETPERRRNARSSFTAGVKAVEPFSQTEIDAHTTDLSAEGCYVDTMNPLPAGTDITLQLTRNEKSFQAKARIVHCQAGVGMGLVFTEIAPANRAILELWFSELRGEAIPEMPAVPPPDFAARAPRPQPGNPPAGEEQAAIRDLIVLLVQKHVVTEDEGEAILRRLSLTQET